jgi:hypothetical protein
MKLKKANLALLLSSWYPYADAKTLQDLTYFVGWMFLIDDEIDKVSGPSIDDAEAFQALHHDTISFVERSLGLQASSQPVASPNATIDSFRAVGEALCARYAVGK